VSDARRFWAVGFAGVIVIAVIAWSVLRGGDEDASPNAPAVISQVASWMGAESGCEELEVEASPIPVGPHGPPGTFFQMFGELPEVGALSDCGALNGFVGWFRFKTARAMDGALRRHPELTKHEIACTHGSELVIDSLFGYLYSRVPGYCRQLGFSVHEPPKNI
jgi:hypothetical protein